MGHQALPPKKVKAIVHYNTITNLIELNSNFSSEACDDVAIPVKKMNADIHASAEYRAHLVKVMTKRAVAACIGTSD